MQIETMPDCEGVLCNYREPHRHGFACDPECPCGLSAMTQRIVTVDVVSFYPPITWDAPISPETRIRKVKAVCQNCDRSLQYDKELDLYLDVYGFMHCEPSDPDAVLHEDA